MGATYEQLTKRLPPACTCDACQMDCTMPCWGTPAEIRRLIDAGHGARLTLELWTKQPPVEFLTPALKGSEGQRAPAKPYSRAGCTFWTEAHLCQVHDAGLKPLEGKLSHHHPALKKRNVDGLTLRRWIAEQWDTDEGRALIEDWKATYLREDSHE